MDFLIQDRTSPIPLQGIRTNQIIKELIADNFKLVQGVC